MIVSFLNEKGGVGKTTNSINFARALTLQGKKVLFVDSDPQKNAREWHFRSEGSLLNMVGIDVPTIDKDIEKLKYMYEWIIIDGAGRLSPIVAKSILCSDIVIIPIQPSPYDIWGSEHIINLIQQRIEFSKGTVKAAFLVSNQKQNTKFSKEIREVLKEYEPIYLLNAGTYNRIVYSDCATEGKTVFEMNRSGSEEAKLEILNIANEIMEMANELIKIKERADF